MRVVHVNLAFEPSSDLESLLQRYVALTRLCESQADTGTMRVIALQRFSRNEDAVRRGVVYHARVDDATRTLPGPWTRPAALWRLVRELQPDIVHFNGLEFPLQLAQLARTLRAGSALVVQDRASRPGHRLKRLVQRWVFRKVDGFLFTAVSLAHPFRACGVIGQGHIVREIVGQSSDFGPQPRDRARAATAVTGQPVVLWVGRLMTAKDPETAIEGFARARERLPQARLYMIYQREDLLPAVEAVRRRAPDLADSIQLVGPVPHDELEAWYSAADLFLTSSPREGGNWALVESLACGLLPVCSDNPVNRRLTREGEYGVLFPVGSVDGCARAIVEASALVSASPDALRASIRRHFEAHLSWPAIARASFDVYRELLDRRRI